jgi:two-component system sensor histidine kinase CpxA
MSLRGKLFSKIFLGFWLVTTAVLASWMFANHYFEANPGQSALEERRPGPPHRFVLRMIYDLQNVAGPELPALLERARQEHKVEIFLLDRQDADILERVAPQDVAQVAAQLQGPRRRAHLISGGRHLYAYDIYRGDEGSLRAVFVFRPSAHHLLRLLGSNLWLRIGLAVLISGLLCYALSLLMTRRLKALQQASRRLATGDLDTRLNVRQQGGDETDELARDFNSMAQQLQERIHAQKRLLADVSHELRSPLARLRIALALAQEKPADAAHYLRRIEQEAERLEELIGQLLASQAGNGTLDSQLDLVALLNGLIKDTNFEGAAEGKHAALQTALDSALVASTGDLLHKGLENILRNALRHTSAEHMVLVTLTAEGDEYHLRVEDGGGGVPEDELDKIFDEFYRTDTARTRVTGGHGLGLAITRRAVEQHGGRVMAANTESGLAVTVILPRIPAAN